MFTEYADICTHSKFKSLFSTGNQIEVSASAFSKRTRFKILFTFFFFFFSFFNLPLLEHGILSK